MCAFFQFTLRTRSLQLEGPGPVIVFRGMVSGCKKVFEIQSYLIQEISDFILDVVDVVDVVDAVDVVSPEPVRLEQPHQESWFAVGVRSL